MPEKYAHINFTPPQSVRAAARRGLELRRKYGRGGLDTKEASKQGIGSGVQRATNLANGNAVSPETIGRMVSFFARHEKNKDSKTDSGEPGAGQIAWLLWGGNPGQRWAKKVKRQMEAADMKNKSLATLADAILTVRGQLDNSPQMGGFLPSGNGIGLFVDDCIIPTFSRPTPMAYKSEAHTSAMIALFLPADVGRKFDLIDKEALSPAEMHITLAYLGKADELTYEQTEACHSLLSLISDGHPPLGGTINGYGRFCNDEEKDPFFIIPDLAALLNLREIVIDGLRHADISPASDHGFTPHITLTYIPHDAPNPFDQITRTPVTFPTISLVLAGDRYDYQFKGGIDVSKAALIEKIGARHTGAECMTIQKMHDLALDLGAECHPLTRRAGARHSHADRGLVQRIHDDCVGLGAECKALPVDEVYHSQVMKEGEVEKGSAGSGNFGHDGRKGKRGGSGKGGGLGRIGAKKDTPPGDRKKAAEKFREKKADKKISSMSTSDLNIAFITAKNHKERVKFAEALLKDFSDNTVAKKPSDIPKSKDVGLSVGQIASSGKNAIYKESGGLIGVGKVLQNSEGDYFNANFGKIRQVTPQFKADLTTRTQLDAPNYKAASTPQRCKNCKFLRGDPGEDYCTRFDFTADQDYVCDDWQAQKPDEIPGYVASKGDLAALTEGILKLRSLSS